MALKERAYQHKFKEVVTNKFVVRLVDKRTDMPKSEQSVTITGLFTQEASLGVKDARELELALHNILRRTA